MSDIHRPHKRSRRASRSEGGLKACDTCFKAKVRCDGKENPPCDRCLANGHDCTFERSRRQLAAETTRQTKERFEEVFLRLDNLERAVRLLQQPTIDSGHISPAIASINHAVTLDPQPSPAAEHDSLDSDDDPLQEAAVSAPMYSLMGMSNAARIEAEKGSTSSPLDALNSCTSTGVISSVSDETTSVAHRFAARSMSDLDPVAAGICSRDEALRLFDFYFEHCHIPVPIFDSSRDTWENLSARSAFAVTVIALVGQSAQDGGRVTALQQKLRAHADALCAEAFLSAGSSTETVQAMTLLSLWTRDGWRLGMQAVVMSMDLSHHLCLPQIVSSLQRNQHQTAEQLEAQRDTIIGARTWLILFKTRYELAYNLGRPIFPYADELLRLARSFIEHPLSTVEDCRLVSTCELLTYRLPLFIPFRLNPVYSIPDLDSKIRSANDLTGEWITFWDARYAALHLSEEHDIRSIMRHEYCHAIIHTNAKLLSGIKTRSDLAAQSAERRSWVLAMLRSTESLMRLTLNGKYAINFRFANHYTHVAMAFAARFLIRLASLLPEEVDLRQIGRDIEALAAVLNDVPGFRFGQVLQEVLKKARMRDLIPARTRAPSVQLETAEVAYDRNALFQAGPEHRADLDHTFDMPTLDSLLGEIDLRGDNWMQGLDFFSTGFTNGLQAGEMEEPFVLSDHFGDTFGPPPIPINSVELGTAQFEEYANLGGPTFGAQPTGGSPRRSAVRHR